ncbi:SpaA isopeptide-forming pilin-related protein [Holdemanella porci]|uniref:SpaA isopeptide-forming pilin-related protein n=1 Tax=Holdemanella porci TaxID=2652276 RepID=UPI003F8E92CA
MQYSDKKQRTRVSKILRRVVAMVCVIVLTFAELIYAVTAETDNRKLFNGSFEEGQTFTVNYLQPDQSAVPSWNTTAFQGKIELFRKNTGTYINGVILEPKDGTYAAELNADEESTLYQNVKTTPSSVYKWGLDHGGRNGTDTMALIIGPKQSVDPSKPSKEGRDQFMQMVDWLIAQGKTSVKTTAGLGEQLTVYSKKFAANGTFADNAGNNAFSLTPSSIYTEEWHIWIMASSRATSGKNPWNSYGSNAEDPAGSGNGSGNTGVDLSKYYCYTVPAGQTDTLFGFVSVGYVGSITTADKAKTFGNFLDNINFEIFHPLSGSTSTHGSAVVGGSDGTSSGTGATAGHEVTIDNKLSTFVTDGEPLKIQAVVKKNDASDGCEFVGVYHTNLNENGNSETEFLKLAGNVIEDTGSLTEEEKAGKWLKTTNAAGNIIYTYYLGNITSATDLHFVFIKSPTVTYDPNGGRPYVVKRDFNTDEAPNVYSFKPVTNNSNATSETGELFIPPYVSHEAEGQNDGWKFMGWKLTGDIFEDISGITQINPEQLGTLILPAEHTVACDYTFDGVNGDSKAQYFKIYDGSKTLTKSIAKNSSGQDIGVTWNDNGETKAYANVHKGITMIAQWRWRQAFIPQLDRNGEYIDSTEGGTVEITSVTEQSDNYNAAYNENGGKSYHAAIDERITVKAVAKSGCKFIGWYDESGKLITTNEEYAFVEAKESVKTFYARFSNTITQTYIRQVKNGDGWTVTTDDTIGTLDKYTYTDAVGSLISSTATAGTKYKFVGWYDSEGNKVTDEMLTNSGVTISYTTTVEATYYARFVPTVTQKFIRQVQNGDLWENTDDNDVAKLSKYTHTDEAGVSVSSAATVRDRYIFVGWYDSKGNKVPDEMLINGGETISYTTAVDATYYARFEKKFTLNVSKIDGDQSTSENKVPLAGAEFTLYQRNDGGDKTVVYQEESIKCTEIASCITVLSEDGKTATAVFDGMLIPNTDYFLIEKKAPAGYRKRDTPLKITINGSGNTALIDRISKEITEKKVNVELPNTSGIQLPITGGTGTVIFTVVGIALMVGAVVLLVVSRKKSKANDNK